MDDASRLIMNHGVFQTATAENTLQVLKKKKTDYPNQLRRLLGLLGTQNVVQVVAFTTFIGYGQTALHNRIQTFFGNAKWERVGPIPIVDEYPLQMYGHGRLPVRIGISYQVL